MDWTKAKTILIVALLLTNCILGGLYYYQYAGKDVAPETELDATIQLLADNGIRVDTEIPDRIKRLPVLFVKYDNTDEEKVKKILEEQSVADDFYATKQGIIKQCNDVLKRCGFVEETLVYDFLVIEGEEAVVVYKNVYDGFPLEESSIVCTVQDTGVVKLDRRWLTPIEYGQTKQKVIQANVALIEFMSEQVREAAGRKPQEIHIEAIDLVYWLDSSLSQADGVTEDTAVPAWRIRYNSDQVSYIDAYENK